MSAPYGQYNTYSVIETPAGTYAQSPDRQRVVKIGADALRWLAAPAQRGMWEKTVLTAQCYTLTPRSAAAYALFSFRWLNHTLSLEDRV